MSIEIDALKVLLRPDQKPSLLESSNFNNSSVAIYAPNWVKDGIDKLINDHHLKISSYEICEFNNPDKILQKVKLSDNDLSLKELQILARNEGMNVTGKIKREIYNPPLSETNLEILISLKDLVRQCVLVGLDETTHFGGYPRGQPRETQPDERIIICDLAALQFQQSYNTGRLVLIPKDVDGRSNDAPLDDLIYRNVVGESKNTFQEIENKFSTEPEEAQRRYIPYPRMESNLKIKGYFDIYAYQRFVAYDVLISGLAIVDCHRSAKENETNIHKEINFKFLKYGTGFFAGNFDSLTNKYILGGVILGLELLCNNYKEQISGIVKNFELPFYTLNKDDHDSKERLNKIESEYNISHTFNNDDALKTTKPGLITATTNCGDTMAVLGNEMRFGSVDAAIGENLVSKGNIFSPLLNKTMQEKFIDVKLS